MLHDIRTILLLYTGGKWLNHIVAIISDNLDLLKIIDWRQYFGISWHTQAVIACKILTPYLWEFQERLHHGDVVNMLYSSYFSDYSGTSRCCCCCLFFWWWEISSQLFPCGCKGSFLAGKKFQVVTWTYWSNASRYCNGYKSGWCLDRI